MKRLLSYLPKKLMALFAVVALTVGFTAAAGAWWPERPTYTIEKPADHVTFNSITNNPNYGDERTFFDTKPMSNTSEGGFVDKQKVADGQEYLVRIYVHNNAADNLNGTNFDGPGVAKGAKARIYLPTAKESALRANAYVNATNATPVEVSDTVDFYGDNKFSLSYVPGSAVMYTNAVPKGFSLSDNIVAGGASIGYKGADGVIPGCFQYTGIITIKVKVKMDSPDFTVAKTVSKIQSDGKYTWTENVEVAPGETVAYQIRFTNVGNSQLDNVVLRDQLPKGFKIVPGSTLVKYGSDPTIKPAGSDAIVSNGGLMIGAYAPSGGAVAMFKATAPAVADLACGVNKLTNVGEARVGSMATTDIADVTINKECVTEKPKYTCDALSVKIIGDRKISATLMYTAQNGATFNNATYSFGDNSQNLVTKDTTVEHTYGKYGTYAIKVVPTFIVNGKVVTAPENAACTQKVTLDNKPLKPVYSCDNLTLTTIGDRKISATVSYTAINGATLNNISYNFGDSSASFVTKETTAEHTYVEDGTYTVRATPSFNVDGKVVTADSSSCAKIVTFEKGVPVTPEAPTSTPSTGPAETIGLFVGVSTLGAVLYRFWIGRKLGN